MIEIRTPIGTRQINKLQVYDKISLSGKIYTARDAVLKKLVDYLQKGQVLPPGIKLEGSVIFHTAVSPAGIGPTSSNKLEIESSIPLLSQAGVRIHLGKGALNRDTLQALNENGSIFAITLPVSALLSSRVLSKRIVAFPEEGMEALHELEVKGIPAIVAITHGKSIFDNIKEGGCVAVK